jgi:hypothetical protein
VGTAAPAVQTDQSLTAPRNSQPGVILSGRNYEPDVILSGRKSAKDLACTTSNSLPAPFRTSNQAAPKAGILRSSHGRQPSEAQPPPNPAPKGRKKTAQDEVQDASPDEVLGKPRKKIQAPHGRATDRTQNSLTAATHRDQTPPKSGAAPNSLIAASPSYLTCGSAWLLLTKPLDYPLGNCHALTDNGTRGSTGESEVAGLGQGIG